RKPFMPAFRLVDEDIVTFHDVESDDNVFGPLIKRATRERTDEWLSDPEDRKVITSLLNMAVSRHAYRIGLREDGERPHRYFFVSKDGLPRSLIWKPFRNTAYREVVGERRSPMGEFWRHAAAY